MRLGVITVVLSALMLLAACHDPAANKSHAVTSAPAAPSPQAAASGQKFVITPEHCKIEFTASQVTGPHSATFQQFSGEIDYAGAPEASRVSVNIDTSSLNADDPKLTKHLKTPDFFDVAKYPTATFVSTAIKAGGEKGASHTVTGNLTLHGVTKSVTFPATIGVTPDAINVDADFTLKRQDFNLNYVGPADNLVRDNVVLTLKVHATKS